MTPLLGDNYDTWLPLVILIFCLLTFFNLHGYLFRLFRIKGVVYRAKGNEDSINEGRVLLEQGEDESEFQECDKRELAN